MGRGPAEACDVWALARVEGETASVVVEAKAGGAWGGRTVRRWLAGGGEGAAAIERSRAGRAVRWERSVRPNLPAGEYGSVRHRLAHRAAAAVIEARRMGLGRAVLVVQAFGPAAAAAAGFEAYRDFARAAGVPEAGVPGADVARGAVGWTDVGEGGGGGTLGVRLGLAWAECPAARDEELAECGVPVRWARLG